MFKYLAAERELKPRIAQAEHGVERLRQELQDIEQGTWTPPAAPPTRLNRASSTKPRDVDQPRGPFRRFISTDGLPIFVGRNARENDELTFSLAKSDDLWLHARGTPGSHVVVRLGKGAEPPVETLRDAATLALLYSDMKNHGLTAVVSGHFMLRMSRVAAPCSHPHPSRWGIPAELKKSGKGEVVYTRRKWVKKAKGQAPGAVIVTQEKSFFVSLDRDRLNRLKTRS